MFENCELRDVTIRIVVFKDIKTTTVLQIEKCTIVHIRDKIIKVAYYYRIAMNDQVVFYDRFVLKPLRSCLTPL
jgi:hypothetical protein